jgi:alcohol dehydrogenase
MLGATHACANPLTARYGTTHGDAIGILLPHVVRWNRQGADALYGELVRASLSGRMNGNSDGSSNVLAARLAELAAAGKLPKTLREAGASEHHVIELARDASEQWTGRFNPRPFDADGAREIYQCAF